VNSAPIENKETLQHIVYAYPTICHLAPPPPPPGPLKIFKKP